MENFANPGQTTGDPTIDTITLNRDVTDHASSARISCRRQSDLGLGDTGQPQYSTKIAPLASSAHQALNVGTLVLLFLATVLLIDAMDSFPGLLPLAKGANP